MGILFLFGCGNDNCSYRPVTPIVYSTPPTVYPIPNPSYPNNIFNIGETVYARMPNGIICTGRIVNFYNGGYILNPVYCYGRYYYNVFVPMYNVSRG